jgi:hypothetical protein
MSIPPCPGPMNGPAPHGVCSEMARARRPAAASPFPAHFKLEGEIAEQGRPISLCEQPHRARRLTIVNACSLYVLVNEDLPLS